MTYDEKLLRLQLAMEEQLKVLTVLSKQVLALTTSVNRLEKKQRVDEVVDTFSFEL